MGVVVFEACTQVQALFMFFVQPVQCRVPLSD